MNKIWHLFDENYVLELFQKRVLPKYPVFKKVEKIKIIPHKRNVWEETYHVVIEFKTYFRDYDDNIKSLSLFCSAHSSEPRKNVYFALKYLWNNSFGRSNLTIPRPLFYSDHFKATFYRGVQGNNLYSYIKDNNLKEIEKIIPKTAYWFAKLHQLPPDAPGIYNFNKKNSRIKTAIPGRTDILDSIYHRYPEYYELYKTAYQDLIKKEDEFLKHNPKRYLVHGDAHPENIIKVSSSKLAVIDFTDLCLSDYARDLGCFLQQFEYMTSRKLDLEPKVKAKFITSMKDLFLAEYFSVTKVDYNPDLEARITNYYYWTMIRSATFLLIKAKPQPEEGKLLVAKIRKHYDKNL